MRKNKGFTLIELMIVVAIIAIIAAIAVPNLLASRMRANEATAVTCLKNYASAQVTYQVGKQGRLDINTPGKIITPASSGAAASTGFDVNGFCSNYRNLYYGQPVGDTSDPTSIKAISQNLALISRAHADAYINDQGDTNSGTGLADPTINTGTYQGYLFDAPSDVPATAAGRDWYCSNFGLVACPEASNRTGNNMFYTDAAGAVYTRGLDKDISASTSIANLTPISALTAWSY